MVIAHNLTSANAARMFGINTRNTQYFMEKLSSGYRINRAADDAAGLAISEKMRTQIRGLNRASQNALDGISVIQTAEGAFGEMQAMLQRMNELCTQGANDTNTHEDRRQIQQELDQLLYEIDETTQRTQFNTKQVLQGINRRDDKGVYQADSEGKENFLSYYSGMEALKNSFSKSTPTVDNDKGIFSVPLNAGASTYRGDMIGAVSSTTDSAKASNTALDYMGLFYTDSNGVDHDLSVVTRVYPADPTMPYYSLDELVAEMKKAEQEYQFKSVADNLVDGLDHVAEELRNNYGDEVKGVEINHRNGQNYMDIKTWSDTNDPFVMKLQVGSLAGQSIDVSIEHLNARALEITGVNVKDFESAGKSMKKVQNAIDKVSTARANLGAQQNRLEHTIKNLDNVSENTQAAESRIRDSEMARMMVEFTKSQILSNASQSMIANARRSAEGVLALLS